MNNLIKKKITLVIFLMAAIGIQAQKPKSQPQQAGKVWSVEKANDWYTQQQWISGANFLPSTAINQLEMWQAESFDPVTIDRELEWAHNIGFNTMRVFLHSIAWKSDPEGFNNRVDVYLDIAQKHKIKTMFVFFDDCWNKSASPGKQPEPKTGVHNSGWVQDPGDPAYTDAALYPTLERYVKDVMGHFKNDKRILLWDLYNEPGNQGKGEKTLPLLKLAFAWAREINPDQPLTAGIWAWDLEKLNQFQIANSDVITYHNYEEPQWHQRVIELLKIPGRPLICSEYMARTRNNRFSNTLPMLKKYNVGAINWGLVAGKSNTIYAWDTPLADGSEPIEWFHDIFKRDGKPYREDEINLIKKLNSKAK